MKYIFHLGTDCSIRTDKEINVENGHIGRLMLLHTTCYVLQYPYSSILKYVQQKMSL